MKKKAFTFLEALVTMFLVAAVFGVIMLLLRDSIKVANQSKQKDLAGTAAQVGLERMSNELWEAVMVDSPALGATSTDLIFAKVDQTSVTRLAGPGFNAYDPDFLLTVHYKLQGTQLIRDIGPRNSAATASLAIADEVAGMQCTQITRGVYYLTLSVWEGQKIATITTTVTCPGLL